MSERRLFFFYGVLMDADVLAVVIGRRPPTPRPATLSGFRRVYRAGATYPILIRGAAKTDVDGQLVEGLSASDIRRLRAFEGPEYRLEKLTVQEPTGQGVMATVFLPRRGVSASTAAWSFPEWVRRHRLEYLHGIRGWEPERSDP